MTQFASVGRRAHYTPAIQPHTAHPNNPLVAHCGAIFFPAAVDDLDDVPMCHECHVLEASRLYAVSDAMADEARHMAHEAQGGDE